MKIVQGLKRMTHMPLGVGILLSAVVLLAWIPDFVPQEGEMKDWWEVALTMVLTVVNAFAIWLTAFRLGVVKSKDGLPAWLYILSVTTMPMTHACWRGQIAVLLLIGVMRLQYGTYKSTEAAESAFVSTLLLCVASVAVPDMIWFVPLSWLAYLWLRSFNLRIWSATVLALMAFSVCVSAAVLLGWMDLPYADLWTRHWVFVGQTVPKVVMLCTWIVVGIGWVIVSVLNMWYEADKRRVGILLVGSGLVGLSICLLWSMPEGHLLPVFAMLYSAQALLYFRQRESVGRSIGYTVYLLVAIASYTVYYLQSSFGL